MVKTQTHFHNNEVAEKTLALISLSLSQGCTIFFSKSVFSASLSSKSSLSLWTFFSLQLFQKVLVFSWKYINVFILKANLKDLYTAPQLIFCTTHYNYPNFLFQITFRRCIAVLNDIFREVIRSTRRATRLLLCALYNDLIEPRCRSQSICNVWKPTNKEFHMTIPPTESVRKASRVQVLLFTGSPVNSN